MDTKKLRQKILDLAIHGKLVPQDPNDEPASVLLERIRAEKEKLIKEGKIKPPKRSKSAGDTYHYPKEVPFEVPEGWVWCRLEDIGDVVTGTTPSKSLSGYYGDDYPFFKPTDLEQGINTIASSDALSAEGYNAARQIPFNSILVTCIGATIGKTGLIRREGSCNQQINAIIPNKAIVPEYLYSCCISNYFQDEIHHRASATTLPILNKSKFSEILIPIPPINEQRRILERLSSYVEYISIIEEKDNVLESIIQKCKNKILDLAIHGKLVPQSSSDEPAIELLRRINPSFQSSHNLHYGERLPNGWTCGLFGELNQHRNKSEDPLSFPDKEYELYSVPIYETGMPEFLHGKEIGSTKQIVDKGDVLLCKINPYLNRSWVVSHYRPELKCIASSEWLIFSNPAVIPDYARLFFMSPQFKELMLSNVSGVGGSLMRARASAVNNYPIWIPPINEQVRIVNAVNQLYATIEVVISNLA